MSKIKNIKAHNKNVLDAICVLNEEKHLFEMKTKLHYVNFENIDNFFHFKNALMDFYNKLSLEYNRYVSTA